MREVEAGAPRTSEGHEDPPPAHPDGQQEPQRGVPQVCQGDLEVRPGGPRTRGEPEVDQPLADVQGQRVHPGRREGVAVPSARDVNHKVSIKIFLCLDERHHRKGMVLTEIIIE